MNMVRTMSQVVEKVTPGVIGEWTGVDQAHYAEQCSGAETAPLRPANPNLAFIKFTLAKLDYTNRKCYQVIT